MHARAARGSHAVALTDSGLGLKRASREWRIGLAGPIWLCGLAWVLLGPIQACGAPDESPHLDLKLDSKIRLYIISLGKRSYLVVEKELETRDVGGVELCL